jgi:hypothetical protein
MELHIRDVSKTYSNGVQALKDVTLTWHCFQDRYPFPLGKPPCAGAACAPSRWTARLSKSTPKKQRAAISTTFKGSPNELRG